MSDPAAPATERQVLYALVSAGFVITVVVLIVGAVVAGLVPTWWTIISSIAAALIGALVALRWKDTRNILAGSVLLLVFSMMGTLLVS